MKVILGLFLAGSLTSEITLVAIVVVVLWKQGCFDFTPRVVDRQFVSGCLTNLNSSVSVKVFYVYAFNINVERRLLWCRLFKITSGWSSLGVVMSDFNAIRLHFEVFGGTLVSGDMEEFDLAIHEADLVESLIQSNWFTWTSKVHESSLLCHLDRI